MALIACNGILSPPANNLWQAAIRAVAARALEEGCCPSLCWGIEEEDDLMGTQI
jgi:hypothetical protein